jgi:hypothetical protein
MDYRSEDVVTADFLSHELHRLLKEGFNPGPLHVLEVSPRALDVPDIDNYMGLAHTLFALEDLYGVYISDVDGELCLRLDKSRGMIYVNMFDIFDTWRQEAEKLRNGEISKKKYDAWRYNYPNVK